MKIHDNVAWVENKAVYLHSAGFKRLQYSSGDVSLEPNDFRLLSLLGIGHYT